MDEMSPRETCEICGAPWANWLERYDVVVIKKLLSGDGSNGVRVGPHEASHMIMCGVCFEAVYAVIKDRSERVVNAESPR